MPLYEYKCTCGNRFAEIKHVDEREICPCPECGEWAKHVVTPVNFDPKMGLDPAMPTFYDKWAAKQVRNARGKPT